MADYNSQELRVLAEESNDSTMKKALLEGEDLHQQVADATGLTRRKAKTISFGVPYGKSEIGFSIDLRCSIEEAKKFLDSYFKKYPSVLTRIKATEEQVKRSGYVINMNGRRRRFPNFGTGGLWKKKRCFRQAFNFLIQSYSADMLKVSAARIIRFDFLKLVNLIHDELVVECPEDRIEKGKEAVRWAMEDWIRMSLPVPADIKVVKRYGEVEK